MDLFIIIGLYAAISFVTVYALWIFYLAVMNLKRVRDQNKLTKTALYLGLPVLWTGFVLDAVVNIFVVSVMLLEVPKELLVTSRFKRHNASPSGWRKKVVTWFEPLLDPFDPDGNHI